MKILVINCGSSSLKYQLIDMTSEQPIAQGLVERIGIEGSVLTHKVNGKKYKIEEEMKDHKKAIELVLNALVNEEYGVIKNMEEISAVGHRVVHGGEKYAESVLIDSEVMEALEDFVKLAPLHNPPNIIGINACKELMSSTPMVAVFDTAFHQTLPDYAYMYSLPYDLYEKHGIRKYGFHGTSHKYVSAMAAKVLGKNIEDLKLITCHLGNGSSLAAVKNGKCVDTSMGFTPLAGLTMGTRCGDIDPAIVTFLIKELNYSVDEVNKIMNKESGVLGISGISSDFRDILKAASEGNERAELALNIFKNKVIQYIGAYTAVMGGVDAIIFTAGVGENSEPIRKRIISDLGFLGIKLDEEKNKVMGETETISTEDSKVKVLAIPTNEELMIARDTKEIVEKNNIK
ncbi:MULTISPECIES: acetate/propionate family kinase [Clostridium]|uniref:Acetate kinase n=1 Tax=Clostridium novyi (strain NT) TaxID=386415 RepID=ACKA_CLONN|nr:MULTISPECIES: acetate kinase [Clostridium]A0Q0Z5.1 RecName: Full=Acetate kinase; AltName: Full=Acetokinase [Clostridium novyi NT]ABK60556.1 acetate kinase [Clostridium novyi NT]KEH88661.1 acetate kinase [Clostridium novyi A str. NCTC 538]KEH89647.1 acetate kinase [Clostridium novyi A str. BKT29909]KEH94517.1 acetate kinase [Clostridium botulinum C/D str. It1]